ncbi:MAG TPA: DUF2461 domain-containing protein [Acidimicrobiia bacterium]|nr:DUF2461 domain-containing protein [Acidimicrobiia bacterium]
MPKRHFSPSVFAFLRELEENNDRAWWDVNKDRYLEVIREPARDFIVDFAPRLEKISPHFVADTHTVGGSLMRPYRDTRFSKDRTPYKTNVGIQFRHEMGKDVHAPGFYLHLEPGACFTGVGMWRPEAAVARQVREAIYESPDDWRRATKTKRFTEVWEMERGEGYTLKRVPRELDPDHPYPDDLRLKSFIATTSLTQREITSSGFDSELARKFVAAANFTRFLCDATGIPF